MYKVISLFSGCGGSSLGYQMAGLKVLLANEFVPEAANTYRANFPNTLVIEDDIRKITGKQILDKVGLQSGELDILDGSPPCQGFSMIGKREEKWGKVTAYSDTEQRTDDLFFEYARVLKEIQPKVFVAENVPGIVMGKAKAIFDEIYRIFEDCGYNVSARIINAKYFGVAQNRPRLIFIGVRKDLNTMPSHPEPQTAPTPIKDVWVGLVNTPEEIKEAEYPEHYSVMPLIKQMKPGEKGSDYHPNGSYFGLARLDFDKPANTILQADAKHISCSSLHPVENRKLTIPELKRVGSFPDNFILTGTYAQKWERIGRAVPPLMMKAIAEHIRYRILDSINGIINTYKAPKYTITRQDQIRFDDLCDENDFKEFTPDPIDIYKDYKTEPLI
jgi:DNA (cytosine-5)-methyltransferase 1